MDRSILLAPSIPVMLMGDEFNVDFVPVPYVLYDGKEAFLVAGNPTDHDTGVFEFLVPKDHVSRGGLSVWRLK